MASVSRGLATSVLSTILLSVYVFLVFGDVFVGASIDVSASVPQKESKDVNAESVIDSVSVNYTTETLRDIKTKEEALPERDESDASTLREGFPQGSENGPHPPPSSLPRYRQTLLQYYLKRSTHNPVCVVFKETVAVTALEERTARLWAQLSTLDTFSQWQLGVYNTKLGPLKGFPVPEDLPSLRCHVGTALPEDFLGKPTIKRLLKWFKLLSHKFRERIRDANVDLLKKAVSDESKLTILAFPGEELHYDVEWMLLDIRAAHPKDLELFVVHPGASNEDAFRHRFTINMEPTILVLKKGDKRLRVWQRFEDPFATRQHVEPFMIAQTSLATSITVHNFQREVLMGSSGMFLVCFYSHWADGTVNYLETFVKSMEEFRDHGVQIRFGTVDVEIETEIVPRWLHVPGVKGMPFTVLFKREPEQDGGRSLKQIAMPEGLPTPTAIGSFLMSNNITLQDSKGDPLHYALWVTAQDLEVSMGMSSLISPVCITGVNTSLEGELSLWTEGLPDYQKDFLASRDEEDEIEIQDGGVIDSEPKEALAKQVSLIGSIPQVTDANWFHVIEQSHADMSDHDLKLFVDAQRSSAQKDTPKTNLVFFIQEGCGSCRRQQATFERVAAAIEFIEGGSAYVLNCTSDSATCARLGVRGFPTIIAFRTFGRHSSERCLSPDHHQHTLRMDFHGVMQEKEILEWFSEIAVPRVQIKRQQEIQLQQKLTDVIVKATIYPQSIAGQYLRSVGGAESWYPLDCFQVACERLYGKAMCYAAYGDNIRAADQKRTEKEEWLIVSKVEMIRRDGITSRVITSGRSLIAALQEEAESQVHKFHTPHKYNLRSGQRCEDDHAACTDLITEFVEDHSRLPVTHITMTSFHAYSSVGFDTKHKGSVFHSGLPVLIAMAHRDQMEEGAAFQQAMQSAAYDLYQELVFTWVDVDEFPKWVARFVPYYYQKHIIEHENEITEENLPSLMVFPRLCIVRPDDHRHAAFYPPVHEFSLTSKLIGRTIGAHDIVGFAQEFLMKPDEMMVDTEHF